MIKLKDMAVSRKVVLAFLGVLAATLVLGTVSLLRLTTVGAAGEDTFRDGLPTTVALGQLEYYATRFRAYQASYVMPITLEERAKHLKVFADFTAKVTDCISRYRDLANTAQEYAFADSLSQAWQSYHDMHEPYLATFKTKGESDATAMLVGPMRAKFSAFLKTTEAAVAYNTADVGIDINHAHAVAADARLWIIGLLALAMALSVLMGLWLVGSVSKPLGRMTEAMDELAKGNLEAHVPHSDQGDEIGRLAGSMAAFKGQLAAAERSKAEQTAVIVDSIGTGLSRLAKGDLTHRVTAELSGAFAKLQQDFNAAAERLQETLQGVLDATHQIAGGAGEISTAADDLSRRTEQQAASLEETAAALEEITATVKKTAANAREADTSVGSAKTAAEEGGRVVGTAITAMDAIAQSSKQITEIIAVIDEIAFQTNLLALNAGVEAARAGDAGRGFAVVASEVRALAQRSSDAAKQIKTLISESGSHVELGVKQVGESGQALRRIVDQVHQISALVGEMAGAAEQQSSGIEEVNTAVGSMDQVTQQNAAMVEQSTAASRHLADETRRLQELVSFFDVGIKAEVRAPVAPPRQAPKPAPSRPRAGAKRLAVAAPAPQDDWTEF